jgi:hypothetical protein
MSQMYEGRGVSAERQRERSDLVHGIEREKVSRPVTACLKFLEAEKANVSKSWWLYASFRGCYIQYTTI